MHYRLFLQKDLHNAVEGISSTPLILNIPVIKTLLRFFDLFFKFLKNILPKVSLFIIVVVHEIKIKKINIKNKFFFIIKNILIKNI